MLPWLSARWLAPLALCALLGLGTGVWFNAAQGVPQGTDFLLFVASAQAFTHQLGLYHTFYYAPDVPGGIQFLPDSLALSHNLNPPVLTLLTLPLVPLDLRTAYYVWCAGQVGLALLAGFTLLRQAAARAGFVIVLCVYYPVLANLQIGQMGLLLFALLALYWHAAEQGQVRRAGVLLGLALLLKLFVGLIFVWLLLQRRWAILIYGAAVWAVGMGLGLLLFGVANHRDWLDVVTTYSAGGLNWNASLYGVVQRYTGGMPLPALLPLTLSFGLVAVVWLNQQRQHPASFSLGIALCCPLMLLLTPLGWIYYFPVLLLSALILWQQSENLPHPQPFRRTLIVGMALSGVPQLLTVPESSHLFLWRRYAQDDFTVSWFVAPEVYPLALALLCALPLWLAYKARSTHTGA